MGRRAGRPRTAARAGVRQHPGDGADRDDPRGVRDGGDPLRPARPHLRAQRRSVGLPVLGHQALRRRARAPPAGPVGADDDRAVHGRVRHRARLGVPSPWSPRHRGHVGVHPQPARPGGHRTGAGRRPCGQAARGRPRLRRHLGRAPRPGRGGHRGAHRGARRAAEPARGASARAGPRRAARHARRRRVDHPARRADQRVGRPAVHRRLARRARCRGHLRPDGGRGDRGDLAQPAVAVDPARCHHRRGHGDHRRTRGRGDRLGRRRARRRRRRRDGTARRGRDRRRRVSLADELPEFLTTLAAEQLS